MILVLFAKSLCIITLFSTLFLLNPFWTLVRMMQFSFCRCGIHSWSRLLPFSPCQNEFVGKDPECCCVQLSYVKNTYNSVPPPSSCPPHEHSQGDSVECVEYETEKALMLCAVQQKCWFVICTASVTNTKHRTIWAAMKKINTNPSKPSATSYSQNVYKIRPVMGHWLWTWKSPVWYTESASRFCSLYFCSVIERCPSRSHLLFQNKCVL